MTTQGSPAQESTTEDRQLVRDYAAATRDPHVTRLLGELTGHLDQATFSRTAGRSGGNTRRHAQGQYAISYSHSPETTRTDHLAVLVHELTHVALGEAYDSDLLNYRVPALSAAENDQVRNETPGREEDVQNARLARSDAQHRNAFVDFVLAGGQRLLDELPTSGLTEERQRAMRDKLGNHLRARPYHEYDAVLSHLLVWADLDGADRSSAFYRTLTTLVAQTADWRTAGTITLPRQRRRFQGVRNVLRRLFRR